MKIGIDKIGFAMPNYYLDIRDLAAARGIEPDKFTKGLLQLEMSIPPVSQDIVTLGMWIRERHICAGNLIDVL